MKDYLRSFLNWQAATQFVKLGLVGVANTITDFALFNVLRYWVEFPTFWAVSLAFLVATVQSYVLNRRWTFALGKSLGSLREWWGFLVVTGAAWAVTVLVVSVAERLWGSEPLVLNLAKVGAVVIVLLPKFAALRDVVFRHSIRDRQRT